MDDREEQKEPVEQEEAHRLEEMRDLVREDIKEHLELLKYLGYRVN